MRRRQDGLDLVRSQDGCTRSDNGEVRKSRLRTKNDEADIRREPRQEQQEEGGGVERKTKIQPASQSAAENSISRKKSILRQTLYAQKYATEGFCSGVFAGWNTVKSRNSNR